MNTCRDRERPPSFPFFLPFPLQTMSISPGTRRTVSVVQVAVPSTEASAFPGREAGKREGRTAVIIHRPVRAWASDTHFVAPSPVFSSHCLKAGVAGRKGRGANLSYMTNNPSPRPQIRVLFPILTNLVGRKQLRNRAAWVPKRSFFFMSFTGGHSRDQDYSRVLSAACENPLFGSP